MTLTTLSTVTVSVPSPVASPSSIEDHSTESTHSLPVLMAVEIHPVVFSTVSLALTVEPPPPPPPPPNVAGMPLVERSSRYVT